MTVKELINELKRYNENTEVKIMDSWSGGWTDVDVKYDLAIDRIKLYPDD